MADEKRKPLPKVMVKGVAKFPYLTHPDTKFKAEGVYTTEVVIQKADYADLIKQLDAETDAGFKDAKAQLTAKLKEGTGADKAKAKKALEELKRMSPIRPVYDDEGNESDELVSLKFSMYAQFKDKKTGQVKKLAPALVSANGQKWPAGIAIWGGSVIKVGGKIKQFFVKDGAGAKLLLEAVKVIELRTGGEGGGAAAYGFDDEEEGTDVSGITPNTEAPDPDADGAPTETPDDSDF